MAYFNSPEGDLLDIFLDDPSVLEQLVGNQLWGWGRNGDGQLGDNTITHRSSPVQTVAGGTNWKFLACGGYHKAGIKTDGTLWGWGKNDSGQLGDNTNIHRSSPVQTVSGGTNWKQVSTGWRHVAAIKTDGTLWLWGDCYYGQLGDNISNNTTAFKSSPIQTVSAGTNWRQVSAGVSHTAAIKTDGTLWLWGAATDGALGDNTTTWKSSPVQTISGGTDWKQVNVNSNNTAAIKTDGSLWLWGRNSAGQLGDGTTIHRSSPVQTVAGGTDWKQVNLSKGQFVCAIKTDGTLWVWGQNGLGTLGDNTTISKSSPVQTISGGTNWKLVSCGGYHVGSIKTDGTLWMWGDNSGGSFGDTTSLSRVSSPIQTVSGTNWKQISVSMNASGAVNYTES